MIRLTLPYPISANRYWRPLPVAGRNIFVLTKEAKQFKADAARIAFASGLSAPISGRIELHICLYPNRPQDWKTRQRKHGAAWDDTVQCIDLDNANKVLLDALKGIAFDDDKWVRRMTAERMEPDADGARVVITITALQPDQPTQAALLPEAEEEGAF